MSSEIELLQQIDTPKSKQEWEKPKLAVLGVNDHTLGMLSTGHDWGSSHS